MRSLFQRKLFYRQRSQPGRMRGANKHNGYFESAHETLNPRGCDSNYVGRSAHE